MDERKQKLLAHIIEAHVKTAQPVGSNLISSSYMKDVSGPTVRNEMQELERSGYITHPHTSAGRIPTEAGYRLYLENMLAVRDLAEKHQKEFTAICRSEKDSETKVKTIAKKAAQLSGDAVVVGFSPNNVYYTGLSNIFGKPEFARHEKVVSISSVIDHLDEVMSQISARLDDDISVLLGSDNPFGDECGSVLATAKINSGMGVVGILGPMRMDYAKNIAFVKYIKKLLEQ